MVDEKGRCVVDCDRAQGLCHIIRFLGPNHPREKSFEELLGVLRDHYKPKQLVIAERYH